MKPKENYRSIPLRDWPTAGQTYWASAIGSGTLLDDRGLGANWSVATRNDAIQGYGRWLRYLADIEISSESESGIPRINQARVADFTNKLERSVSPITVGIGLEHLYHAVRVMAPTRKWQWLREFCTHYKNRHRRTTKAGRCHVDPGLLLDLGLNLMYSAEFDEGGSERMWAVRYRDGLMIALLATRPVRRRTFAAIRIDRQLRRSGSTWWLYFAPEDMKNQRPLEQKVPDALVPNLERYLDRWRPLFPAADQDPHLWQSLRGPMSAGAIYERFKTRTREAFGFVVPPHQFRHAAATAISRHDPAHVLAIAPILGHASLDTAYGHYVIAEGLEASREHQRILEKLRDTPKTCRRRRLSGGTKA